MHEDRVHDDVTIDIFTAETVRFLNEPRWSPGLVAVISEDLANKGTRLYLDLCFDLDKEQRIHLWSSSSIGIYGPKPGLTDMVLQDDMIIRKFIRECPDTAKWIDSFLIDAAGMDCGYLYVIDKGDYILEGYDSSADTWKVIDKGDYRFEHHVPFIIGPAGSGIQMMKLDDQERGGDTIFKRWSFFLVASGPKEPYSVIATRFGDLPKEIYWSRIQTMPTSPQDQLRLF